MMKKLLSVLLSVSMVAIMLAGCGSSDADDSVQESAESAVQEATEAV